MNILTDRLPDTVEICGSVFEINTDFRAGISFELMVEKGEQHIGKLLSPFFPDGFPREIVTGSFVEDALEKTLAFYRMGDDTEQKESKPGKQSYSFEVDGETIYSDFWRYYGVDLSTSYLHWWAFRALLMGLPDDSGFKQRVYYRTCDLSGLPKKERERINKIRNLIAIHPDGKKKLTLEERNAQMMEYAAQRSKEASKGVSA